MATGKSVLYVDAGFTDALIEIAGLEKGVNAFTSLAGALSAVTSETTKIAVSTDITEDVPAEAITVTLNQSLDIVGTTDNVSVVTMNNGGYNVVMFEAAEGASDISVNFENIESPFY